MTNPSPSSSAPRIWTIGALLQRTVEFFQTRGIDEPRLSAELLLAHVLGVERMKLYTEFERVLTEPQLAGFRELVRKRTEHVPVAYLIGKAWFFAEEFAVNKNVLVPRPDTETLVETVITRTRDVPGMETPRILDLCTGSGCIAIALAKNLPGATFMATDVSGPALAVAKHNAERHKVADRIEFVEGDLLTPLDAILPTPRFNIVVSNPPYVSKAFIPKLQKSIRDHEPKIAVYGGEDGMDFHRRIVQGVGGYLEPGGMLIVEIMFNQDKEVAELFKASGYLERIRVIRDAGNNNRCVLGFKSPNQL